MRVVIVMGHIHAAQEFALGGEAFFVSDRKMHIWHHEVHLEGRWRLEKACNNIVKWNMRFGSGVPYDLGLQ